MFILNWIKQYYEIKYEAQARRRELQYCESCENLKMQIATLNQHNERLLNKLLEKPESVIMQQPPQEEMKLPKMVPWRVRQQLLETEDRAKARALKNAAKTDEERTEELEKELDIAEQAREKEG